MKRRYRKPVLDLNGEADSSKRRWPGDGFYSNNRNGSPPEQQPSSDGDQQQYGQPQPNQMHDQVNDFFAEIQCIAPNKPPPVINQNVSTNPAPQWQECFDENTGYPYYWHTKTNEVTWEMPAELKALKNSKESKPPEASPAAPQWPNRPPKNFPSTQSNIPDGMIPKEVVARNRYKQQPTNPPKTEQPAPIAKTKQKTKQKSYPPHLLDNSDDGKIEMITSFGNDTESEESEDEKSPQKKNTTVAPPPAPIEQSSKLSDYLAKLQSSSSSNSSRGSPDSENDFLKRLKTQDKVIQSEKPSNPTKSAKMSLVPGYDDDSEGDEESPKKQQLQLPKPLFPIMDQSNNATMSFKKDISDRIAKHIETPSGSIKVYDYRNNEPNDKLQENVTKTQESTGTLEREEKSPEKEEVKTDLDSKANKFLESLDPPSKAFQRKKRIAFDVASKTQECQEAAKTLVTTNGEAESSPKEEVSKSEEPPKLVSDATKKYALNFVKGETMKPKSGESSPRNSESPKEMSDKEKEDLRSMTDGVMEKLKFLSEGSTAASAVQIMAIQLQTLMSAWETKSLQDSYLENWLKSTSCELIRLEQTAAPAGWECQWDRIHKRYFYRNKSTDESQWTYPQADIAGGTEEMELCTTPPPPELEESPIIEMNVPPIRCKEESVEKELEPSKPSDEAIVPPPPPIISSKSPSPPPPPKLDADDLKIHQEQKMSEDIQRSSTVQNQIKENIHRGADIIKTDYKDHQQHRKGLMPHANVEAQEIAYALQANSAFEALYAGHQQINPIYAATLSGGGIPIISHHPALGQIMHYPTYQHHLHNPALMARFSGQEAAAMHQFMVHPQEYAPQMYDNNQVITKPPVKAVQHDTSLGSAINSFYSDIASIESKAEKQSEQEREMISEPVISAPPQILQTESETAASIQDSMTKEKKKKKLKTGIGKKQKEMSSMVAKWQKAQKNYKDD